MHALYIVSSDAPLYAEHLSKTGGLSLIGYASNADSIDVSVCAQADIVLADPGLVAPYLDDFSSLKWLQSTWAGIKPLVQCTTKDIVITGVKDVFGKQMREYVFAYLLHDCRRIDQFTQLQHQHRWQPPQVAYLQGKTIGIMGVGSIGTDVAKMAKAFDMTVKGLNTTGHPHADVDCMYSIDERTEFAQNLDYLVILLPHTDATENIVDADFLAQLPNHALLINGGRGQVINDSALISALNNGELRLAVLDVFHEEPLPADHPFWQMPNVYISQHTAAISQPEDIVEIFKHNFARFKRGEALQFLIDTERGY